MTHEPSVAFPPVAMLPVYRDLTRKLLNISLTVSDSTHKHSTRTFTIQQPWDKWERSWDCPCNLRHNMVVDNSPITSQPESLGLYWMGTEVEPWPFSNRKLHNVCSWASFMIGLHYLPTIHERKSGSLFYLRSISPFLGQWGLVYSPAFHNSLMRITNTKHSWENCSICWCCNLWLFLKPPSDTNIAVFIHTQLLSTCQNTGVTT